MAWGFSGNGRSARAAARPCSIVYTTITALLLSLATDHHRVCHCVTGDRQRCLRPLSSVKANAIQPTVTFGCLNKTLTISQV